MSDLRLPRDARVFVIGSGGLAGSAVVRRLRGEGFSDVVGARSAEVDLRGAEATRAWFERVRPAVVVDAVARVGVDRLLSLGSSCIYPNLAPQPIREDSLLTGALEETNDAYAVAKIAGITAVQAYRREYGRRWISAMPTNMCGPGDNFHPEKSHVLPALILRSHEAVVRGEPSVTVWGTGTPRRQFLHTDDLASASCWSTTRRRSR